MVKQRYHPEDHDKALPFLSVAEATLFRDLVKEAWARQGREITMFPDHAEGNDGCMIGFWNLAADCHKYPQRMWPRIIAEHARLGLIDPSQDFFKGMSHKEVLRHTYVRLFTWSASEASRCCGRPGSATCASSQWSIASSRSHLRGATSEC